MTATTKEEVLEKLRTVRDPELDRDLVSLDMVKKVVVDGHCVSLHIELTTPACPLKDRIGKDVKDALERLPGVESVAIEWSARVRSSRGPSSVLPAVKNIIAVGAGKGGVGKSTVAVALAYGLHRAGAKVGLMDSDVYGPSIPTMTGIEGHKPAVHGEMIVPPSAAGVKIMSIGFMVDRDKALIWRGPMAHGVVRQFLEQVEWGELDYLIVDLPPGTGDVPLSLAQQIPLTGAIVVCTPQDVALIDARRAVRMYEQLKIDCLGMIENMSYYLCPQCGHRDELFDHGGAEAAAKELNVPFLGAVPLNAHVRRYGDSGAPEKLFTDTPDHVRQAIQDVVQQAAGQVSIKSERLVQLPTLTIE